jgi:hypothetical protein
LCEVCQVEWSTPGQDHGPCFCCESTEHVVLAFEVPAWAWGYRW